ncbi:MAG: hypothetical protein H6747_08815 [Deltaproteobacteria bacterium]|nr:hypothetical protein [Deltaproteobacteria bacterium]
MATNELKSFKRLNFFRGFRTTEKDWNEGESYHVEKHRLHNRMFHGPGLVPHALGGLHVSGRGRGELAVEVQSGYAIDGAGNDIFLWEPEIKQLNPGDFKLPTTVYLVVRYLEEFTDFISYKENLDFKGHRRVTEGCKVEWTVTEPDVNSEIELCRVALTKDVKRITDAKDPFGPAENEIDLRYVPVAGCVGSFIDPKTLWELLEMIRRSKAVYAYLYHQMRILPASDVLHAFITLEMLMHSQLVDLRNVFKLYMIILSHQWTLIEEIEQNVPQVSSQRDFANFKKHVEIAMQKYDESAFSLEFLNALLGYQTECYKFMETMFDKSLRRERKIEVAPAADTNAVIENIKVRSAPFEDQMVIEGINMVLVDMIDPLDPESEREHQWKITGERDRYRTRQKLKYPDGVVVEDTGVAFEGGQIEFELRNIEPGKDIYVVWRMDYVHGDWEAEVESNDRRLPNCICAGSDRKFRWRNWVYVVPAEHVREVTARLKMKPITADRDINVFKMWAFQPITKGRGKK